ncbi:EpsG family protein [Mucilaginibacter sp.]|jgi:hypothetical protein|uniref:EpsG family protein n=1 Tax=Mucilaginibacter sp. TaxID=1882438 RepID=UPI00356B23C0
MVYFLIFIFFSLLSLVNVAKLPANISLLIFFLSALILVSFAGFRGDIEGDYASYKDVFQQTLGKYTPSSNIEPGYYYFNHLIITLGLPFQIVIIFMAIFSIVPKLYFFNKYSYNFALSVLIYYCTTFFIFDFIQIRQAVAIAIFMISLKFIRDKKIWFYLFCIVLAAQIHISAIILIPGYYFFNRTYSKKILYGLIGICSVISILHITVPLVTFLLSIIPIPGFTETKLTFYQNSTDFSGVSIKQLLLAILFVFIRDKYSSNDRMINIFINLFVIGLVLATLFNGISELSFRIKWYFLWTESLLMVYVVRYISKYNLTIIYTAYLFIFILYGYSLISLLNELASRSGTYIFPYKFFSQ